MVAAASLMESATDLYTANLIEHFAGDDGNHVVARAVLAARGIAARQGLAPLCRDRLAGFSVGTGPRPVHRRVPAVLRRGARSGARPGDGVALRRRNGHRQLLHQPVAGQPRAGAEPADPPDRRGRGPPLQAFLSFFPQVPRDRAAAAQRRRPGLVAAAADDRRRRPADRAQARPRRAASGRAVSTTASTARYAGSAAS